MPFLSWVAASTAPSGAAGGDLGGTYPSPTVVGSHLASPLPVAQGGTNAVTAAAARTSLGLGTVATLPAPTASARFSPANPASTVSLTLVMMGVGATVAYTPATTGIVLVTLTGWVNIAVATNQITVGARYGTGTAPVNGAAVTGTRFGSNTDLVCSPPAVTKYMSSPFTDILTLTPATAYWFDLALATSNAGDAVSAISITATFVELLA